MLAASPISRALQIDLPFFSEDTSEASSAIRDKLSASEDVPDDASALKDEVRAFYEVRNYRLAWSGTERAQGWANRARYVLQHAHEQGLRPANYFSTLTNSDAAPAKGNAAAYDIAMTAAVLRYVHDVHTGRFQPRQLYKDVGLPPRQYDAAGELRSALRHDSLGDFFDDLPPAHAEYRRLVAALAHYRAMAASGETPEDGSSHASVAYRMQQIAANMERWRWMPAELENRYIQVDVPAQTLEYIHDGQIVLQSRVVIGRRSTPTPIMRTVVQAVIANPAWYIADDIAVRQILPHLRSSHGYLAAHNITFENGQFKQAPGPHNALGLLMLDTPNEFWVYMHDTPSKNLFSLETRERSNGCVRVEKIFQLASLALTNDPDSGADTLTQAIASGQTEQLLLPDPLPVYMVYWTARANEDGTVEFYPDRYGRDATLIAKLGLSKSGLLSGKTSGPAIRPKPRPVLTVHPVSLESRGGRVSSHASQ